MLNTTPAPGDGTGPTGPPVVVWDLGNVLIPWERTGALLAAVGDPDEAERLAEEVFTLEVNALLDAGASMREVLAVVERDHPGTGWAVEAYVEHFGHSLGPVIDGSAEILAELNSAGVRCVGLSNWSAVTFEGIPQAYPALSGLEGIVISGEVGVTKPDREIFLHCQRRFGFEAHQAVFIDDSPANVAAAVQLGWQALLFEDPERLRRDLGALGVPGLTPTDPPPDAR